MLNRIIRFSLGNRVAVLLMAVLLIAGGIYVAFTMEVDVFPDLNAPTVTVMTEAGGMAPEEVERLVTFPVETAVNGAAGVRRVRSQSTTGFSVVWVEFDWGTNPYRARQIVSEKLSEAASRLPASVERPVLGPQSSILGEVMIVGLTADSTSLEELRTLADWRLRPRLLATGGVAAVSVLGGDAREYQIQLDPGRMKHYDVSLDEVLVVVDGMNRNAAGGVLYEHGNEYIVRGVIHTRRPAELGAAVVKTSGGGPVRLDQVARIATGPSQPRTGTASNRLKPAVLLTVTKQAHTGTLDLTERLDAALQELKAELPPDVQVDSGIFRQSRFIESAIGNIRQSLFEGGLFVALVLFVFLLNARTTLISLVTIPLALLVTLLVLRGMGLTINTMSIGGMAIAIGSLVDDAIVDVENVFRRLRENRLLPAAQRLSVRQVVFEASKEVRIPILNSTLIIVAGFMPLFFLSGMEGRMLVPLGVAFIVSLFASTAVALTLTPVLCSYLLGGDRPGRTRSGGEPRWVRGLKTGYLRLLQGALTHRRAVLAVTGVAVCAALGIFFTLGRSFLPPFNEGSFTVNVSTLPGVSLEVSDSIGREAERILLAVPEIITVARKTGRAELDEHSLGVNTSELEAPFELVGRTRAEVVADVRARLGALSGVNVEIGQPISHRIDAMLSGTQANIAIKIFGPDLNRLYALGRRIQAEVADVEGVVDLNVEQQVERPQLQIVPRREMLARYGVSPAALAEWVEVVLGGRVVGQVYEDDRAFDLTLRAGDEYRSSAEALRRLTVDTPMGKVPLSTLAEVKSAVGPNTINRENVARKIVVSANVDGRDLRSVVNDMRRRIEQDVPLPDGYRVEYGGQFESEQAASRTLGLASLLALLVIFGLLYHQFRSTRQALVVLLNLPLALIGGVWALWVSDGVVSIPAIIGFISLFGIATRNGILLIDRYNDLRRTGLGLRESVLRGSADRLNPIVMTALTSALALIPLVLGDDLSGNEIQSPMAKVMLGGLLSSTLLNGFVVPVTYLLVQRRGEPGGPQQAPGADGSAPRRPVAAMCLTGLALLLAAGPVRAQRSPTLEAWLDTIERNNTSLRALRAEQEAQRLANRAEATPEDPAVEFHYLWGTESSGAVRKDVSVAQTLDWATLTGTKRRVALRQDGVAAWQYHRERNALRWEAERRLLEAVYANRRILALAERAEEARRLAEGYETKLRRGDASMLELNRARMNSAACRADLNRAEAERTLLLDELRALNGGHEVAFADTAYALAAPLPPDFDVWYAAVEAANPVLRQAGEQVELSRERMRQARREAIPPLSVGYMSERATGEGFRGLTVGVSVPLWGARTRLKQSRADVAAAQTREADLRLQSRAWREGLFRKVQVLQRTAEDYREVWQQANPAPLLRKALEAGDMSLLDYLTERAQGYEAAEQAWAAERDYRLALAELQAAAW